MATSPWVKIFRVGVGSQFAPPENERCVFGYGTRITVEWRTRTDFGVGPRARWGWRNITHFKTFDMKVRTSRQVIRAAVRCSPKATVSTLAHVGARSSAPSTRATSSLDHRAGAARMGAAEGEQQLWNAATTKSSLAMGPLQTDERASAIHSRYLLSEGDLHRLPQGDRA